MSHRRPAAADAPSTLVDPDYRRRRRAELEAEDERSRALAGPLEVSRVVGGVRLPGKPAKVTQTPDGRRLSPCGCIRIHGRVFLICAEHRR